MKRSKEGKRGGFGDPHTRQCSGQRGGTIENDDSIAGSSPRQLRLTRRGADQRKNALLSRFAWPLDQHFDRLTDKPRALLGTDRVLNIEQRVVPAALFRLFNVVVVMLGRVGPRALTVFEDE